MNQNSLASQTSEFPETEPIISVLRAKGRPATLPLLFSFFFLFMCLNAKAGNESAGDENKVVWQNPTPQLSQNAARSLLAAKLGGLDSAGYMLVTVKLEAGKPQEVRSLMSSGSLIADQEICQFVLDHWVFNPKAAGVYKFPVLLPAGL
jgi:hypothetical protein